MNKPAWTTPERTALKQAVQDNQSDYRRNGSDRRCTNWEGVRRDVRAVSGNDRTVLALKQEYYKIGPRTGRRGSVRA